MDFKQTRKCLTLFLTVCLFFLGVKAPIGLTSKKGGALSLPVHLAPSTQSSSVTFVLNPKQRQQAKNLIQTLGLVISFLEAKESQDRPSVSRNWLMEEAPEIFSFLLDSPDTKESLIPAFSFYNVFGLSNLRQIRKVFRTALDENLPLPRIQPFQLDPAFGLYLFSRLTHPLKPSPVIDSLTIQSFHRRDPDSNQEIPILLNYSDSENGGIKTFRLVGESAQKAANAVFANRNGPQQFKQKLLDRTSLAIKLTQAIGVFTESISRGSRMGSDKKRHEMLLLAGQYYEFFPEFILLHMELQQAMKQKEWLELKERLSGIKKEIETFQFVLGSQDGQTVSYFNMPALVQNPKDGDTLAIGVTKVAINLPHLLEVTEHPARLIINEIVFRLLDHEKTLAGPYESSLSQTLGTFPPEVFKDDYVFYNLIKILSTTAGVNPFYKSESAPFDFELEISQNIFQTLQKANPTWFKDSLNYLDDKDKFEVEVEFLAATGWIDSALERKLLEERENESLVARVKELLSKGFVVTLDYSWGKGGNGTALNTFWAKDETLLILQYYRNVRHWGPDRDLKNPFERLALFNFIKHKIFFAQDPFTSATTSLAFMKPGRFNALAEKNNTVEKLTDQLSFELGKETVLNKLNRLYQDAMQGHPDWLVTTSDLFDRVSAQLLVMGEASAIENYVQNFRWLLHLMGSFLDFEKIRHFLRGLFFFSLREEALGNIETLYYKHINPVVEKLLKEPISFPLLSKEISRIVRLYPTAQSLFQAHEEEGELNHLQALVAPSEFLKKFQEFISEGEASSPKKQQVFILSLVENRVLEAYVRTEEEIQEAFNNAAKNDVSLTEMIELSKSLVETFLQNFGATFQHDPYIKELGLKLHIPLVLSSIQSQRRNPYSDLQDSRSIGYRLAQMERQLKRQEIFSLMTALQERGLFRRNRALRRFIDNVPDGLPPFDPSVLEPFGEEIDHLFAAESREMLLLEESL